MGDRTITIETCLVCGEKYECYDAPSSVMYVGSCSCGYEDPNYYSEKKRELQDGECDCYGEGYTYDLVMKKHTKNYMRKKYERVGKTKGWIEKALDVDFGKNKERFVDIKKLIKELEKQKDRVRFLDVLLLVEECIIMND